jgi:hypothetical protein
LRRKCILKSIIEGRLDGRISALGRRGSRRKQLLDDFKENKKFWKLKEEAVELRL